MKSSICSIIIILLLCFKGYGEVAKDSSGVYVTKTDFTKNKFRYFTPYRLKEKFGFLRSDFEYEARGVILLKNTNKETVSFEPGEIYGFYNEGKKFLYIPDIKRYLYVLNEEPVTILVGEETTFYRFNTNTDLQLFYLNTNNKLESLNTENVNRDFDNQKNIHEALADIQKKFKESKHKRFRPKKFSKYIKERFSIKSD
jgi:hypothetical protein